MATRDKQKPRHLGRGLQSLLGPITSAADGQQGGIPIEEISPNRIPQKELGGSSRQINIDIISPNPYQPRTVWDETELEDLAASIRTSGIIQPILVRPVGDRFELIAGERRLRAARMADLEKVPVIVRRATDEQMLELALIENIHRTDLNALERGRAYQNYIESFSLTQAEAAEKLGENRSVIANHLRLLDLPAEIKQMLRDGRLTMGHARAILALPTDQARSMLANRALAGRLSVREVERLVRKFLNPANADQKDAVDKLPHILDLEDKLTRRLGTKVRIETRKSGRRGRIVIEFFSLDEFDRITEAVGLSSAEKV